MKGKSKFDKQRVTSIAVSLPLPLAFDHKTVCNLMPIARLTYRIQGQMLVFIVGYLQPTGSFTVRINNVPLFNENGFPRKTIYTERKITYCLDLSS